jgi:hypothetical protein
MSIQENLSSKILFKIFSISKIFAITSYFSKKFQYLSRSILYLFYLKINNLNVFFPYYNYYTHPDIKKRYYGKNAPLKWTNLKSSKVVHCIQAAKEEYLNKKIIIEPSDHCLTIGASLGIYEPCELVSRCDEIGEFILSKIFKVIIGRNDLINHAKYYFSKNVIKKFFVYPEFACEPKVDYSYLKYKNKNLKRKIKFLSIASNFKYKAVDLLIEAFLESKCSAELILVCNSIPDNIRKKIFKNNNIFLIESLLLSDFKKDKLYKSADIYINTTYIDGGFVAPKALEYGLPIITHTYHRGKSFIENNNGILLSEPIKYYDPKRYGICWNSMEGYLDQVNILKKKGGYEKVQKQLISAIKYFVQRPDQILNQGLNSLELAKKNNLNKSNQILRKLYKDAIKE